MAKKKKGLASKLLACLPFAGKVKKKKKKKVGKVITKAKKLKNNLSKKELVKKFKKKIKKTVLKAKKITRKVKKVVKKSTKLAVKVIKREAKKAAVIARAIGSGIANNPKEFISMALDMIPIVGNIKAGIEAATGRDPITGRVLSTGERIMSGAAIFGGVAVKLVTNVVKGSNTIQKTWSIAKNINIPTSFKVQQVTTSTGYQATLISVEKTKAKDLIQKIIGNKGTPTKGAPSKGTPPKSTPTKGAPPKSTPPKGTATTNTPTNGTGLKSKKLSSEQIELDWLDDKYTAVEVKGTVKVSGKEVDVSRRVYQIEIDKNYVPNNPKTLGKSNRELMKKGNSPYIVKDGVESKVELHHLIQKEPGGMVEIAELTHDKYDSTLHGLVGNGNSFRNNPELEKMYNNFRSNYWKMRARE